MKVQFGDLKSHYANYKNDIDQAVNRVLESGYFILGPELANFEKSFAEFLGSGSVAGCGSGTDAIYLALACIGVGPDHEVIVPSHTAVPTICAIRMTGATPVFVDICPSTYLIDPTKIEEVITPKTKAIVPVHLYGQMAPMDEIMAIAQEHNIKVIEDCAQSTGATYKGKQSGTIGDFGAFSFYPSKNLGAFGDGGAVSSRTEEGFELLKKVRNYGQSRRYYNDMEGINSRLDEMQAAILSCQIPHVDSWNQRRIEIAEKYTEGLKDIVNTPSILDGNKHVFHLYVIQTSFRQELESFLSEKSIQALIHYPVPAHLQEAYKGLNYSLGSLPVTEAACQRILSLPMYPGLSDEQIDYVIESICQFYKDRPTEVPIQEHKVDVDRKSNQVANSVS